MRRDDASCAPPIGGWCTPKVTLEGPAALLRSCHLQSALCAEVMVTDTEDSVVAHAPPGVTFVVDMRRRMP